MTGKLFLLGLLLIRVAADTTNSGKGREPSCSNLNKLLICNSSHEPFCGSDGATYGNECMLCVQRHTTKENILIVKDGIC
ncbi:probable pancreatic secretory proteinase inhibitor [Nerophis ophidion]|uniref:probable pancreatic secretory proteinase inhibitor n=1 Tax=Nerophis ophidion TaxID=159077 RepID=UPI002ADFFA0E|nr:probable pancreatic secretory proteinase inhibitor [Nerophis ophidion]